MTAIYKKFFVLFLMIFSSYGWAQNCTLDQIDPSAKQLSCLKDNILTKAIRANVEKYNSVKKTCPGCIEPFINAKKYSSLFKNSYMVLGISPGGFGGDNLYVIFRRHPLMYKMWLYPIDEGIYELRSIAAEKPTAAIEKTIRILNGQNKYWIDGVR